MRCVTRIIFVGFLMLQTENHRGVMISAVLPKSYPPLHKMLNFDYNHLCFFAGVLQDEMYHQNDFLWVSDSANWKS